MFKIFKKGVVVKDRIQGDSVTLPPEKAGLAMVFRTFDKMSFALVLTANLPISVKDIARNPES